MLFYKHKLLLFIISMIGTQIAFTASQLVQLSTKNCISGLKKQPDGGPFSVFIFCDAAQGENIGVINTTGAAGPGTILLPHPKVWRQWTVYNRFWQDKKWSSYVTSFAWSTNKKYLYVATAAISGTGELYLRP